MIPTGKDTIISLFDAVCFMVEASGGDGDGWIVSPVYKELANLFGEYAKKRNHFISRWNGEGFIGFGQWQESIVFVDEEHKSFEARMDDVTVYIPWDLIEITEMCLDDWDGKPWGKKMKPLIGTKWQIITDNPPAQTICCEGHYVSNAIYLISWNNCESPDYIICLTADAQELERALEDSGIELPFGDCPHWAHIDLLLRLDGAVSVHDGRYTLIEVR